MQPNTAVSLAQDLKTKIATRSAKIGVIGLGYVGLPLALLFTEETFPVTGFDIDSRKIKTLGEGGSYIFRIPAEQIQAARRRRAFRRPRSMPASRKWMRSSSACPRR